MFPGERFTSTLQNVKEIDSFPIRWWQQLDDQLDLLRVDTFGLWTKIVNALDNKTYHDSFKSRVIKVESIVFVSMVTTLWETRL